MSLQFYMPLRISMRVQFSVYFIPSSCRYKLQRLICNQDLIGPNAEKLCNYNYKSEMSKKTEHNNQITNTVERLKYLTWRTIVENAMYSQGFINGSICLSIGKFNYKQSRGKQ